MSSNALVLVTFEKLLAILSCVVFAVTSPAAAGAADPCAHATSLPVGASLRSPGGAPGDVRFFALEVPEPGLVSVDVSTPGPAATGLRLAPAGRVCAGSALASDVRPPWLERSVHRLELLAPEQGTFFFRVAAQDPRQPLGGFKVTTGFLATADLETDFSKEEDDGVFEIDPDVEADDPEDDAGKVGAGGVSPSRSCWSVVSDDHGDTPACATFLSRYGEVAGRIENPWGDDEDYFALRLTRQRTIRLTTAGPTDTYGSLYDRRGHLLAADDDGAGAAAASGGDAANFRIVKTLSPGVYFVRVEGSGAARGPYRLRADVVGW